MKYKLEFRTAYHQFSISDYGFSHDTGDEGFWTLDAMDDRLAIGDGVLGIGTECYGPVEGDLTVLAERTSNADFSGYDHVVEGSLVIKSGTLQVLDCPNSNIELELRVDPGEHRVRIYSMNLDSVDGDLGDDYYQIEIWPEGYSGVVVIKQYQKP